MLGALNSVKASSAALRMDCAARPGLPAADSGRMSAARTWPLPSAVAGCGGPAAGGGPPIVSPPHAASSSAVAETNRPSQTRRPVRLLRAYGIETVSPQRLLTNFDNRSSWIIDHSVGEALVESKRAAIGPS